MKQTRFFFVLFVLLTLLFACTKGKDETSVVRLGTGGAGGNYYSYGKSLDSLVRDKTDTEFEIFPTQGSKANLRLLEQGFVDMAFVQSDILRDALEGRGDFSKPVLGIHSVTGLYVETCQIVVSAKSGIAKIEDLVGKRVSIGEDDSGVRKNARMILRAADIPEGQLILQSLSFADSAKALADGKIDAFFVTAGSPTKAVAELAKQVPITLLSLPDVIRTRLCKLDNAYQVSMIPKGSYVGQDTDVSTVGVSAVLVAKDTLSKDVEKDILAIIQTSGSEIEKISFPVRAQAAQQEKKVSKDSGVLVIPINMYLTLTLAVCVLYLGVFMRRRITFLETFCIPAPVIGGLIFAIISCILHSAQIAEFTFDETLKNVCMIMFFTSVGFQANFKVLKSGGVALLLFLLCVVVLIVAQNGLAVVLAKVVGVSSFIGLCTGSIPMVGGHGTAGAFGSVLQDLGLDSATTLCTAAATFGLVAGSLMGGPLARNLIVKHRLLEKAESYEDDSVLVEDEEKHRRSVSMYAPAAYQLAIAMGLGTITSYYLSKTGMTFPAYIGAMIIAAIMRNVGEFSGKFTVHMGEINDLGGISLSLFLGIAMVTLKLWQLASLALPLFILLSSQTVLMALFAYYVVFRVMGKDYDAAVLTAGICGFGMGATPNAMANMQALTDKFRPSIKAYILVPIVGSMFADFFNSLIITFFINFV